MRHNEIIVNAVEQARQTLDGGIVVGSFEVHRQENVGVHLPAYIVEQKRLNIARHSIRIPIEIVLEQTECVLIQIVRLHVVVRDAVAVLDPVVLSFATETDFHFAQENVGAVLLVLVDLHTIFRPEIEQDVILEFVFDAHVHSRLADKNVLALGKVVNSRVAQNVVPEVYALGLVVLHWDDGIGDQVYLVIAAIEEPGNVLKCFGPERVVGIQKEKVLAFCGLYARVTGRRHTTVLLGDNRCPRMPRGEALKNAQRAIR